MLNLYQHVNSPEARLYLSRQLFEEAVHVQFSLTLLDTYVPDEAERAQAFAAVENISSIARKARFCFTWIDSVYQLRELRTAADRRAFLLNLICFAACIEGLFFYGAFPCVYFLRSRGLLMDPATSSHGLHGSEKDGPSATCKKSSNVMSKASICGQEGRTRRGSSQNTGGAMGNATPARRLSRAARTGLRDLPSNAAWLLSKTLAPAVSAGEGASKAVSSVGESMSGTVSSAAGSAGAATLGVRRKAKAVRQSVVEAVPGIGHDSVASLMQQADAAAEQARDEEARALELAQQAKDSAADAERVARESDQFVQEVRREAERKTADRMAEAQERFDRARLEAEAEARDTLEKAEAQASARTRERQQNAEQAQVRAREALQEANNALGRARDLAGEAAKAAKDVAAQASREADRLAKQAQERMTTIERRATQAEKTKQAAEKRIETAGAPPHGTPPDVTLHDSQSLDALTKDQLLRLAEDLELESQSAASKQELIEAMLRKGGVPASALSKEELLRIARSTGSEVGTSMTKAELISAIDTSLVPVAGQQSERETQCVYSVVRASGTVLWTPR